MSRRARVLVAGVGNVLRSDDAFGVEAARRLEKMEMPKGVKVVETGIGGMALVQELQGGWDALIVLDCVDLGRPPGQVMTIVPDVIDVNALSLDARMDLLADMHLATPERVFMLSKALGVLPDKLIMIGCQPVDPETPGGPMSSLVEAAIDLAIEEVFRNIREMQAERIPSGSTSTATAFGPRRPGENGS